MSNLEENQQINRQMGIVLPGSPLKRTSSVGVTVGTIDGVFLVSFDWTTQEATVYIQGTRFTVVSLQPKPTPPQE